MQTDAPASNWTRLEEPPELLHTLRELPTPPGTTWWTFVAPDVAADAFTLYAAVWGSGTPGEPHALTFVSAAGDADGPAWYPPLELIGPALEELLPGGVVYAQAFPPTVVGAPGEFAINMGGPARGVLQLVQVGAVRGSPAGTRWELAGGGSQGAGAPQLVRGGH